MYFIDVMKESPLFITLFISYPIYFINISTTSNPLLYGN